MNTPSLSIVIPVFNEEKRLPKAFLALTKAFSQDLFGQVEVIFIDDGSTDNTRVLVESCELLHPVRVLSYDCNRGKGYAVAQGMLAAEHDYALLVDVDMSTDISEIKHFLSQMHAGAPIIIGTRKAHGATIHTRQPWWRESMGKVYTMLARYILNVKVTDFTCGFKFFHRSVRSELFEQARIERWSYDAEILFLASQKEIPIIERPVEWEDDRETRVRLRKDVIRSFVDLLKIRFMRHPKYNSPMLSSKKK
jgi:dolichyl-phosphate beta-glucosyltransferase